jgi:hypothetical protein
MALVLDQKGNRADLVRERQRQAEILAAMKSEEAGLSVHRRAVATARLKAALAGADRKLEFASGHQLDRRGAVLRRTATKKAVKLDSLTLIPPKTPFRGKASRSSPGASQI